MQENNEFYTDFTYTSILSGSEEGVTRRDPSPVIKVGELYYVWYSRSIEGPSGYYADVWYATSSDGVEWTEQCKAVGKGGPGAWDENGVFTPSMLVAEGRYYVFYTAVPSPFTQENPPTPTAIGVAVSESPDGPWIKFSGNPVVKTSPPGEWDSGRVDDSCLIVRGGKYWLYYKGRQLGLSPGETKMGLAIADNPTGPYVKHEGNPILTSGHEVCVWPHREGVAALLHQWGRKAVRFNIAPTESISRVWRMSNHPARLAPIAPMAMPMLPTEPGLSGDYARITGGNGLLSCALTAI